MKNRLTLIIAALALLAFGCKTNKQPESNISITPEAGTTYNAGAVATVKASYPSDQKIDSVVYLVDSVKVASKKDSSAISLKTDTMRMGVKLITAKIYQGGTSQDISTNIVVLAAKAPEELTYKVEKVFPHDVTSYTEGLEYHDGYLYESSGGYSNPPTGQSNDGQSSLRKVDLATGKIVQMVKVDPAVFAEGIAIVGNKIVQLTYHEQKGFVYDKNTFKLLNTFSYVVGKEGWGLCFDGKKLYTDDSTNRIWFLDKDNYRQIGFIDVYDDKKQIDAVNELEYIDGKLYANVYQSEDILVIDPKTGAVLQRIDMKNIYPKEGRPADFDEGNNVLNGIAYDKATKRIFVTGKRWPHLYQVKFIKK